MRLERYPAKIRTASQLRQSASLPRVPAGLLSTAGAFARLDAQSDPVEPVVGRSGHL
jgi:hypothetical protein